MKSVALHNLGCKVNSYELEVMQQKLQENGYVVVPFSEKADIYIINTCTVTNIADRKSRQMLHRAKQMNPDAVVVAVGCYVQQGLEKVLLDESIDLCVGNNKKKDIVPILEEFFQSRQKGEKDKTLGGSTVLDMSHLEEYEEMQLSHTDGRTRAYIKIQDGCNQFCSYCAIPLARGRVRSRRPEDIKKEIGNLAEQGYREIVLTGIHISSYGIDFDGQKQIYDGNSHLVDLVEEIHDIPGIERIRLGSLEPRLVTEQTAGRLAALGKVCSHFHLSLQSGCDATLRRMNRKYTTGEYLQSVTALRDAFDQPAITTDVIVGFPGETEEEFETTKAFLQKIGFYEMHIFQYSPREGTVAAGMKEQVSDADKKRRSNILLSLEKDQSAEFRRKYIGKEAEVLLEEEVILNGEKWMVGHTKDYVKVAIRPDDLPEKPETNRVYRQPVTGFLTEDILM